MIMYTSIEKKIQQKILTYRTLFFYSRLAEEWGQQVDPSNDRFFVLKENKYGSQIADDGKHKWGVFLSSDTQLVARPNILNAKKIHVTQLVRIEPFRPNSDALQNSNK